MADVVVVAGADPGHALPGIGLGAALVRQGHRVRLVTADTHRSTAGLHGLGVEPLPTPQGPPPGDDLGGLLWGRAASFAVALAERLRDGDGWEGPVRVARPDVVVADSLLPAVGLAAQLLGVPWVELIPHHLPDPAPDLPPVGLGRRPARGVVRHLDDRLIHRAQQRSLRQGEEQARTAAREAGLDRVAPPALRLVATVPGLERRRRCWPPTAHVVGPLAVDPALPLLAPPSGNDPLVVVTDTTARGIARSIGEVAIDALADVPVRLVVTSSRLPPRRDGSLAVGAGPHGPLLAEAALAVGPGGGGFVSKAMAAGVPMVVVPLAGDQREAAARLRDAAVGRAVAPSRLSPRRFRWAILRQLADRGAVRRAAELAGQAAALGPGLAADLVQRVAAGERPNASGPAQHLNVERGR